MAATRNCSHAALLLAVALCVAGAALQPCQAAVAAAGAAGEQQGQQGSAARRLASAVTLRGGLVDAGASRALQQEADRFALNSVTGGVTMEQMVPPGYPLENHKVYTEDGWVLNMYRIPYGKYRNNKPGKRPVVMLLHGITLSSACFTLFNANESMAYILADAGFDVWMPNTRGNTFSRGNTKYSAKDPEYWAHTIDEYATIDIPASIDKALQVSGAKKLGFVGHSQGCTVGYAMLAALPAMNDKISVVIHMGPVVFIEWFRAPFLRAMSSGSAYEVFRNAQLGEFLWFRWLSPFVSDCRDMKWIDTCATSINQLFYGPSMFIGADDWPIISQTWPASVSSRNTEHWSQMMQDRIPRLQHFDHGTNCSLRAYYERCNQLVYGSMTPPEYDLGKITAPQVIFEGQLDLMAVPEDVAEQRKRLKPDVLVAEVLFQQYSHMDFVWDRSARHMPDLVSILFRYAPGTF